MYDRHTIAGGISWGGNVNSIVFWLFVCFVLLALIVGAIVWVRGHLERDEPESSGEEPAAGRQRSRAPRPVLREQARNRRKTVSARNDPGRPAEDHQPAKGAGQRSPRRAPEKRPEPGKPARSGRVRKEPAREAEARRRKPRTPFSPPEKQETAGEDDRPQSGRIDTGERAPGRRRLRDDLADIGGTPGTVTAGQQIVIRSLLGKPAPEWMSQQQAAVLLSARYCAEKILSDVLDTHGRYFVEPDVLRRMVFAIVADPEVRDEVMRWDAEATLDSSGNPVYRTRNRKVVRLIENHARELLARSERYNGPELAGEDR